jgi:hypothetical protein
LQPQADLLDRAPATTVHEIGLAFENLSGPHLPLREEPIEALEVAMRRV